MKLLFVVHRYPPYPGGSEYYVQNMAEECLKRGHDVSVFAGHQQGDLNGIKLTADRFVVRKGEFDAIIIHGGDVGVQNMVHACPTDSPKVYMIIKPSESQPCLDGMNNAKILTYSTTADLDHIKKHGYLDKARRIRHGIPLEKTVKTKQLHPQKNIFISVGGFWFHKGFAELANAFIDAEIPNTELHLYGYEGVGPSGKNIYTHFGKSQDEILKAIACANLYIMNSFEEGFGLVLLEAMANKTPWAARRIAGAKDMMHYGITYDKESELSGIFNYVISNSVDLKNRVNLAYNYVKANHSITNTVDDIEDILRELKS